MNKSAPVPRLDLAPKLKRPLQLWNPLDYLLILYWVFFLPQALRWYVNTFDEPRAMTRDDDQRGRWRQLLTFLATPTASRNLFLQGQLLTVVTPVLTAFLLQYLSIPIDWTGVAFGVAFGVAGGMAFGVWRGVAVGVAGAVEGGLTLSNHLKISSR